MAPERSRFPENNRPKANLYKATCKNVHFVDIVHRPYSKSSTLLYHFLSKNAKMTAPAVTQQRLQKQQSYMQKRPLCGHCASALAVNPANRAAPVACALGIYIVNSTHKRPLCGHCASALAVNPANRAAPAACALGIYIVNSTHKRPLCGHCAPALTVNPANRAAPAACALGDLHSKRDTLPPGNASPLPAAARLRRAPRARSSARRTL